MKKKVSILDNRSVIKISGKDSLLFLNNIISNDLEKINNKEILTTTLLSPQGKILFDFFILKNDDYYLIECSKNQLNDLINKLKLYSLRLIITFEKEDLNVIVSNFYYQDEITRKDIRFKNNDVYRHFTTLKKNFDYLCLKEWYDHLRFENLCPEGELEIPTNKLYPFEIDIIYNDGLDFDKGCFIGQEVIARVKYKGSVKKKYISFKINSTNTIDNENINDVNKKLVGSLIYNSEVNSVVFGFGLVKIEYIKKQLGLFCKGFKLDLLN
tara:strand:- start:159 stop:965 length:807 start_codon:yes stop_codon:yes gene_type:complete